MNIGRPPRISAAYWLLWMLLVMFQTDRIEGHNLRDGSSSCTSVRNNNLLCDLTNQTKTDAKLLEWIWPDDHTQIEIRGASPLILEKQCKAYNLSKKVKVIDSQNVETSPAEEDCRTNLYFSNSTVTQLRSGIKSLEAEHETLIDELKVDKPISKFEMKSKSRVRQISVKINGKSTIIDSEVDLVHEMNIIGSDKFESTRSNYGTIGIFSYNSSYSNSIMSDGTIDEVKLLIVANGKFTLKNMRIKRLDDEGIFVIGEQSELRIENSEIEDAGGDGLVTDDNGSVHFDNVTVGEVTGISFSLKEADGEVKPLAMFIPVQGMDIGMWIAIGIVIGSLIGAALAIAIYHFILMRVKSRSKPADNMELIENPQTTPLTAFNPPPSVTPTSLPKRPPPIPPITDESQNISVVPKVDDNSGEESPLYEDTENYQPGQFQNLPPKHFGFPPSSTERLPPPAGESKPKMAPGGRPPIKAKPFPSPTWKDLHNKNAPPPSSSSFSNDPEDDDYTDVNEITTTAPLVANKGFLHSGTSVQSALNKFEPRKEAEPEDDDFYTDVNETMPDKPLVANKGFLHTAAPVRSGLNRFEPQKEAGVGRGGFPPQVPSRLPPTQSPINAQFRGNPVDEEEEPIYEEIPDGTY